MESTGIDAQITDSTSTDIQPPSLSNVEKKKKFGGSPYHDFISKCRKEGMSMSEAQEAWKKERGETPPEVKKIPKKQKKTPTPKVVPKKETANTYIPPARPKPKKTSVLPKKRISTPFYPKAPEGIESEIDEEQITRPIIPFLAVVLGIGALIYIFMKRKTTILINAVSDGQAHEVKGGMSIEEFKKIGG